MIGILSPAPGIPLEDMPYIIAQLLVLNAILLILNIIIMVIWLLKYYSRQTED